jgi:hypothetical protein
MKKKATTESLLRAKCRQKSRKLFGFGLAEILFIAAATITITLSQENIFLFFFHQSYTRVSQRVE